MTKLYRLSKTPEDRFWSKVDKEISNIFWNGTRCWEWVGAISPNGYGKFGFRIDRNVRKQISSHQFSYLIHNGPIPNGMEVCHQCDNRKCVNPLHLFSGTRKDNEQDKIRKGRSAKGERNGQSGRKSWSNKLDEDSVLFIRKSPEMVSKLARKFGVSDSTICDIRARRSWSWL